jgi:hypothetical protein
MAGFDLCSHCRLHDGTAHEGGSPRPQAFPRFSKAFQIFPRKFQGNSKLFQGFPNFFLGRFEGNQGVVGQSSRNRVFSPSCVVSAVTSGPAIRRRTRPRFTIARIPIIGKKLSQQFSGGGLGASAAAHAPTRKPTATTPAPAQLRRFEVRRPPSPQPANPASIKRPRAIADAGGAAILTPLFQAIRRGRVVADAHA